MGDKIDGAIEATGGVETTGGVDMVEVPITLQRTGGRPAILAVPLDVSEAEIAELCSWLLIALRPFIAANTRPRIAIARGRVDR